MRGSCAAAPEAQLPRTGAGPARRATREYRSDPNSRALAQLPRSSRTAHTAGTALSSELPRTGVAPAQLPRSSHGWRRPVIRTPAHWRSSRAARPVRTDAAAPHPAQRASHPTPPRPARPREIPPSVQSCLGSALPQRESHPQAEGRSGNGCDEHADASGQRREIAMVLG